MLSVIESISCEIKEARKGCRIIKKIDEKKGRLEFFVFAMPWIIVVVAYIANLVIQCLAANT